jgi:hypothetical protein
MSISRVDKLIFRMYKEGRMIIFAAAKPVAALLATIALILLLLWAVFHGNTHH